MNDPKNDVLLHYNVMNQGLLDRDDDAVCRFPLHAKRHLSVAGGALHKRGRGRITAVATELLKRAKERNLPFSVSIDNTDSNLFIMCDTKNTIDNYGKNASFLRSLRASLWRTSRCKSVLAVASLVLFLLALYELMMHTSGYHDPWSPILPCAADMIRRREVGASEMYQSLSGGGGEP